MLAETPVSTPKLCPLPSRQERSATLPNGIGNLNPSALIPIPIPMNGNNDMRPHADFGDDYRRDWESAPSMESLKREYEKQSYRQQNETKNPSPSSTETSSLGLRTDTSSSDSSFIQGISEWMANIPGAPRDLPSGSKAPCRSSPGSPTRMEKNHDQARHSYRESATYPPKPLFSPSSTTSDTSFPSPGFRPRTKQGECRSQYKRQYITYDPPQGSLGHQPKPRSSLSLSPSSTTPAATPKLSLSQSKWSLQYNRPSALQKPQPKLPSNPLPKPSMLLPTSLATTPNPLGAQTPSVQPVDQSAAPLQTASSQPACATRCYKRKAPRACVVPNAVDEIRGFTPHAQNPCRLGHEGENDPAESKGGPTLPEKTMWGAGGAVV